MVEEINVLLKEKELFKQIELNLYLKLIYYFKYNENYCS